MATPADMINFQLNQGNTTTAGFGPTVPSQFASNPSTVSAPEGQPLNPAPNNQQAQLDDFIKSYQQQVSTQQQGITYSAQEAAAGLGSTANDLKTQQAAFDAAQKAGLQGALQGQANKYGATLFNTKPGPAGLTTSSVLLQQLQQDNADTIKQLTEASAAATAQGDVAFATKIADMQAQQYQMMLNAKEQIYQGMAAQGQSIAALYGAKSGFMTAESAQQQAATAAAAQREQVQNDVANMATKYGIPVTPGMTLEDLVNNPKLIKEASAAEQLSLGQMRADITMKNATAALDAAQASVLSPLSPTQLSNMFLGYAALPSGSQMQKDTAAQIGQALANNPKNMANYLSIVKDYNTPTKLDLSSKATPDSQFLDTQIAQAQANHLPVDQAVASIVMNNPHIDPSSRNDATLAVYAAYGAVPPPTNPWSAGFGQLGASAQLSFAGAQTALPGHLTDYQKSNAEVGAFQFNKDQPGTAGYPSKSGGNYYVYLLTGDPKMTYTQYTQSKYYPGNQ